MNSSLSGRAAAADTAAAALRLVIADDHVFVRELLAAYLMADPARYHVIAGVTTAAEAIQTCKEHQPDVVILGIRLPGHSATEAVPELKRVSPETRVLICSGSVDGQELVAAIRTGAEGFMEKTADRSELLLAISRLARGQYYFCPRSSRVLAALACDGGAPAPATKGPLSPREREVLSLIAFGQTSKEIAAALGLSCATVDTHRRNLMRKARVRNAAELIRYGQQHGFVGEPLRSVNGASA